MNHRSTCGNLIKSLRVRAGCFGCATVVSWACGGDPRTDTMSIVDSAGVEIITLEMNGSLSTAGQLDIVEALRIGAKDGSAVHEFYRIVDVLFTDDADIVVLDRGNRVVRIFSRDGSFLAELGGEGEGPGMFTAPYDIAVRGDTVVVLDRLIHTFLRDGTLLSAARPQLPPLWYVVELTGTDVGWIATVQSPRDNTDATGALWRTFDLREADPLTGHFGMVRYEYRSERYFHVPAGTMLTPLLEPVPTHVTNRLGKTYYTNSERYQIDVMNVKDGLYRSIRVQVPRLTIDVDLVNIYLEVEREKWRPGSFGPETQLGRRAYLVERLELDHGEFRPVLGRILANENGFVLAERIDLLTNPFSDSDELRRWDVLEDERQFLGYIMLPARFRPFSLAAWGVLGVWRDDEDVPYVVGYSVAGWPGLN